MPHGISSLTTYVVVQQDVLQECASALLKESVAVATATVVTHATTSMMSKRLRHLSRLLWQHQGLMMTPQFYSQSM